MWTRGTIAGVVEILARKHSYTPPPDFGGPSVTDNGGGMFIWPLLLFVGGLFLVILFVYLSYASKQRRRAAFVQMARQLHLTYSEEDPFGLLGYPFALFHKGDGRGIEHVLHGAWQEVDVVAFDYWYYDESTDSKGGTSRTYHRFDCAIAADAGRLPTPDASIGRTCSRGWPMRSASTTSSSSPRSSTATSRSRARCRSSRTT